VSAVDFPGQRVTFETGAVGGAYAARQASAEPAARLRAAPAEIDRGEPLGDVRVGVSFTWYGAGEVAIDAAGKLRFPRLPETPGLYRLALTDDPDQRRPRIYVGETSSLRRRAGNYRNATPHQQTSFRVNGILLEHLGSGGTVLLAVTTTALVDLGVGPEALDLTRKAARRLAENAALAVLIAAGDADIENLD